MEFKVEIISTEKIIPSSPTPSHLRTFKLSMLDQLVPFPYAPIIFYFLPKNVTHHNFDVPKSLETIKISLSETLTNFYPLAGTIIDDLSIDCNDVGASFKEAKVNCSLLMFLNQPDLYAINSFLPDDTMIKESNVGVSLTNIQANVFDCGGIAIGMCITHKVLDGFSLSTFIKAWSSTAFGCSKENIIYPKFFSSSFLPARDLSIRNASNMMWGSFIGKGKGVVKRFVFDASALSTLKSQSSSSYVQNPTRVEVVSALIWQVKLAVLKEKYGKSQPSLITHNVNLRRRTEPPLADNSVGNIIWLASAKYLNENNNEESLSELVSKLRDTFKKFDGEFVNKLVKGDEEGHSLMLKSIKEIGEYTSKDEVGYFGMNSWCNFGFYEADFGWGKPIWVSFSGGNDKSEIFVPHVTIIDTKSGDGIEAWIFTEEQEMNMLERNPELLKYVSVDPSPFVYNRN